MPFIRPTISQVGNSLPFSTSFPATESPISQSGIWINGGTTGLDWKNVQTVAGVGAFPGDFESGAGANDCIAHLKTSFIAFNANQYGQTVAYQPSPALQSESEILLRFDISANNARGYEVYWSTNGGLYIVRWNGAYFDFTLLNNASPGRANDGDVLRAEISGNTISAYINGSLQVQATDSTWASGQPGIGFTCAPGGTLTNYGWKSFTCGNL